MAGAAPVARLTFELWDWVMGINVGGVINGMQTFVSRMIERESELKAMAAAFLARGTPPDEGGQMVLDAVQANRLYIHTDRIMATLVETRARALLEAMPPP